MIKKKSGSYEMCPLHKLAKKSSHQKHGTMGLTHLAAILVGTHMHAGARVGFNSQPHTHTQLDNNETTVTGVSKVKGKTEKANQAATWKSGD